LHAAPTCFLSPHPYRADRGWLHWNDAEWLSGLRRRLSSTFGPNEASTSRRRLIAAGATGKPRLHKRASVERVVLYIISGSAHCLWGLAGTSPIRMPGRLHVCSLVGRDERNRASGEPPHVDACRALSLDPKRWSLRPKIDPGSQGRLRVYPSVLQNRCRPGPWQLTSRMRRVPAPCRRSEPSLGLPLHKTTGAEARRL